MARKRVRGRWLFLTLFLAALCCAAPPARSQEATSEEPTADAPAEDAPAADAAEDETPAADAPAEPTEGTPEEAAAEEPAAPLTADDVQKNLTVVTDTLWVLIAGMLVFFMNLGFGCVESGFCRAKNCVNILSKNFIVFSVTTLAFWLLGWGIMFGNGPEGALNSYVGAKGLWMVSGEDNSPAVADYSGDYAAIGWAGIPLMAKFFFQLVFAATAATIVSGAVAERIKYHSFIAFSVIMAIAIYPVVGHWIWGGGWLQAMGFVDFAGSTQVHSIGGWAALAGILILGPRIGKYGADGRVKAIPGHNLTVATIGCFVLWFGWFGFNPGSTMSAADPGAIAHIAVTTNAAAAAATCSATAIAWLILGKPDLGMTLNGSLAGLVAITAPCAFVTVPVAVVIGLIAGVLVVLSVLAFDKCKIDDPVGATSVHLVNGVFGTLCVGLFSHETMLYRSANAEHVKGLFYGGGMKQVITQLTGIGATAAYVLVTALAAWLLLKFTMGIRVSREEEIEGLDYGEHGNEAYHGFVLQSSGEA
jgi:Amt family ammonium transporter